MSSLNRAEPPSAKRPWLVLCILCTGFFMSLLDGTIINIAIPTLITDIHAARLLEPSGVTGSLQPTPGTGVSEARWLPWRDPAP
ncbi:hypothetical protein [Nonomuraea sp. NPDC050786]|uniref:hypothetical protein n=1 Tax=Nonomuraea sp. NPDC050786 TaxID=3154840 RepID=UPI0033E6A422